MEWEHPSVHRCYRGQIHSRSNSHSLLLLTSAQAHHGDLSQLICGTAKSTLQLGTCREYCGCSCPSSWCLTKAKCPRSAGCAHIQSLIPTAQPPLAGSVENASAHRYGLQGGRFPQPTAKQDSLSQRTGWPGASTHLPRWQRAVTPGRHLLCKDFIPYPVSGCCFHWRKSPANNKKINKYKSQEEAASKLHYFTWAFSSHHRKQLVFSRKNQKMVVHLSLPCGAEQKEAPAVAPSPLGLKAAQRPSLQPQQGLQGLGTAVQTLSQGSELDQHWDFCPTVTVGSSFRARGVLLLPVPW